MVNTPSTMVALGSPAPDFTLTDAVTGRPVSLGDFGGKALLVMFICNHCPFVIHVRDEITKIAGEYARRGLDVVAINANYLEKYPQDGPGPMKQLATELGWKFPFLFDETQKVAQAYRAACTPDFFVYNTDHTLAYRGQMDSSRPGKDTPATGTDLRAALDAALGGKPPLATQMPSIGCNIKWRPGNEPDYFG